jgi:hypothetical protein
VTGSEFAFLALGLLLGVATGAAIVEVLRARPGPGRAVRVTVAPGSLPSRPVTLSTSPFEPAADGPARGGPGDPRAFQRVMQDATPIPAGATRDRASVGVPRPALQVNGAQSVGIPIRTEPDPMMNALRAAEARAASLSRSIRSATGAHDTLDEARSRVQGSAAVALALAPVGLAAVAGPTDRGRHWSTGNAADGRPRGEARQPISAGSSGTLTAALTATADHPGTQVPASSRDNAAGSAPVDTSPCADLRRVSDERCALATRSHERAAAAQEAVRLAQRAYDDHHERADRAAEAGDPRAVRVSKEEAQLRFRRARETARSRADVEAAARDWLTEINRINGDAREATTSAARERAAASELVTSLERLTVEADAARISAESADEACLVARSALADCEEALQGDRSARRPVVPTAAPGAGATLSATAPDALGLVASEDDAPVLVTAGRHDADPAILRMLKGDRRPAATIVEELAEGDPVAAQTWQRALADLLDAIVGRAIEASALDFPEEHFFWGPFTRSQRREIVAALGSLGHRFDGMGGFADDRVPSQRELSLAVGYAGLDPMRIRHWPSEAEMVDLFRDVTVAADEYIIEAAGGFTLGELVSLLGRRADSLTEVWNAWGRLRPLLLETD